MTKRESEKWIKRIKQRVHKKVRMGERKATPMLYRPNSEIYKDLPELDVLTINDIADIVGLV